MQKIVALLLVAILTLGLNGLAQAEPINITDALTTANDELRDKNFEADYFLYENA